MKKKICVLFAALLGLLCSELHAGNLKVNLAPTQAVNAGAQWSVDGGIWRNSGTAANGLSNGTHTVTFKAVSGWIAPAATNVTITNGTTTQNFSYTQAASLKATLSPGVAQWRVDGGVWRASGSTATNMAPGAHLVDYAPLSGYTAPASESVTLTAGQLLSINRSYVQLAQVSVTLAPGSGQWRIDGGTWLTSGATAADLAPGSHVIDYAALAGYAAPASESVTLVAGQTLPLQRNYTQLAQIQISLVPATGQWRADGGAWQTAGSTLSVLPGDHLIEYSGLPDYDAPANETITLPAGGSFSATRSYVSQKPTLQISLVPNTGQWRVDGGVWQPSGALVVELSPGTHTVEYTDIGGAYNPLPSETVSLALRENATLARSYPLKPLASLNVSFGPVGVYAQWRLNGGDWQYPATTLNNLPYDVTHTVEFSPAEGYVAPPSQTFTLASGEQRTLTATYIPLASLNVSFGPVGVYAQWRLNGGDWQYPATTLNNLPYDVTHTVEFSLAEGYVTPPSQTFTLASGEQRTLTAIYTPLASLNVSFGPVGIDAQWRLNGGDWQYPATTLNNLPYDVTHTVEFSPAYGYVAPPPQTFTLASGEQRTLTATYTPLASVNVSFSPVGIYAQWRLNGGDWQYPSTTLNNLPYDVTHTVEFSPAEGYVAPPPQTFTLASGEQRTLTATYTLIGPGVGQLTVTLTPASGQWRVDGGVWQASGATVDFGSGTHSIEYSVLPGMVGPVGDTISLLPDQHLSLNRDYTVASYVATDLNPGNGGPSVGFGINLSGMIAGRAGNRAFRYANGVMQDLGTLAGSESEAYGLNDTGVVVGQSTHNGGISYHAFRHDGTMHDLGALSTTENGGYSQAIAINASGVVVGRSGVGGSPVHAFRYSGGIMEDLGTLNPGYGSSTAHAINDAGVIVGWSDISSGVGHAFRYSGGIMQDLGTLGGTSSSARALNESGVIVGESSLSDNGSHAFRYSNGVMIDLGTLEGPGGTFSRAQGINESGDIVGVSSIADGDLPHAFIIYDGGAMQDLNTLVETIPGVYFYDSFGINDLGQIVASGSDGRAYLLTPINAPGGLQVNVVPATGQWRVDGGPWQTSGSPVLGLAVGNHVIEYSEVAGYTRPSSETVTITSGQLLQLNRSYNPL